MTDKNWVEIQKKDAEDKKWMAEIDAQEKNVDSDAVKWQQDNEKHTQAPDYDVPTKSEIQKIRRQVLKTLEKREEANGKLMKTHLVDKLREQINFWPLVWDLSTLM